MTEEVSAQKKQDQTCSLFPYEREDVLILQEAAQVYGWGISAFDMPEAWKLSQGEGVTVAVLDTGCDLEHPDLLENLVPGANMINPKLPPKDDNGHGSHVTGIICASNNDIGMVGVAPKCKVMPVKVLDKKGNGSLSVVAKGVRWAADHGADIISMSLGAPKPLQSVRKAIKHAAKKNVVTFVAAGNAGKTKDVFFPARYPETLAIGSIDESFDRSNFSNTGKNLDFMAPGGKIFSTVPPQWYAIQQGTSMACPFAVGVAALVLSYARKNNANISLNTVSDYRKALQQHTVSVTNEQMADKKFFQGFGIIDPRKLVEWARSKDSKNIKIMEIENATY